MNKEKYKVTVTPLTAVHIGTGESITPLNYVVRSLSEKQPKPIFFCFKNETIIKRLIEQADKSALAQFSEISTSNDIGRLRKFFHEEFNLKNDIDHLCDVERSFLSLYQNKKDIDPTQNALEVLTMYRPEGAKYPVIPGSSIKGSIRTAILNTFLADCSDKDYNKLFENFEREHNANRFESPLQKQLLEFGDAKNDPFRAVQIEDCNFAAKNTQIVCKLDNVSYNKNTECPESVGMQVCAEVLRSAAIGGEAQAAMTVTIDNDLQNSYCNGQKIIQKKISVAEIMKACNYFYTSVFNDEYTRFYSDVIEYTDGILQLKKKIDSVDTENNECLIRVGRWSQIESCTFEERFRRPKTPKGKSGGTRTLLWYKDNYYPLGWCKLQFEKII